MKKIFLFIFLALVSIACTKEVNPLDENIPINISANQQTKATDSEFESDDQVGVYVVNYSNDVAGTLALQGNHVDNMDFTYGGNAWSPGTPVYWKDSSTPADFYAYYPYSADLVSVDAHPFSVNADQSQDVEFWASDFLWGKSVKVTPTASPVPIVVKHVFSRILVDVVMGEGYTEQSWTAANVSVKVVGVKRSATIDLSSGMAVAEGEAEEITPLFKGVNGTVRSYMAMMVPQTVADNSKLILIKVDGVDYVYRKGFTFKANTQHKFSVTVNRASGSVDVTIGEWDIDDEVNEGIAVEEGVANNQILYTATSKVAIKEDADFGATIASHVFENGKGTIVFNGDVTKIGESAFVNASNLTGINLPESVEVIEHWAFSGCNKLAQFVMPEGVKRVESEAFFSCESLKRVKISSTVESIGEGVFRSCTALEGFEGKYVTQDNKCVIDDSGCLLAFAPIGVDRYSIPEGVVRIGASAFPSNTSLLEVTIPEGVESVGSGAFYYSYNMQSIQFSQSVTEIGEFAFMGCRALKTVSIPESVTYIGKQAFSDCSSLEGVITIPAGVTHLGESAFVCKNLSGFEGKYATSDKRCLVNDDGLLLAFAPKGLEEYSIPEDVKRIAFNTFYYYYNLKSVIIPAGVEYIEGGAFMACQNLSNVICCATEPPVLENDVFSGIPASSVLKVPAGSVTKYADSDWNGYFSTIEEIGMPVVQEAPDFILNGENKGKGVIIDNLVWAPVNSADLEFQGAAGQRCPEGWRLPTMKELSDLTANKSSFIEGYYFSGSVPYSSTAARVWFPANGRILFGDDEDNDVVGYVGTQGFYWSSEAHKLLKLTEWGATSSELSAFEYGCSVRCVKDL